MPRPKKKYTVPSQPVPTLPAAAQPVRDYFNLPQAAEYLGVKVWTIRRLIKNKSIAAKPIGKFLIVRRADLDAHWQSVRVAV